MRLLGKLELRSLKNKDAHEKCCTRNNDKNDKMKKVFRILIVLARLLNVSTLDWTTKVELNGPE